ncbi:MAG: caspase family protein [Planctomycetales bacterium]|nr:caspase family protein [Planctomycetales bacterium]
MAALALAAGCGGTAEWQARYDAGFARLGEGNAREAVTELEAALALDEGSAATRLRLGDAYTLAREWEKALRVTEGIFQHAEPTDLSPADRAWAWRRIGVLNLARGLEPADTARLQRANDTFDRWIGADPQAYDAHLAKGLGLLHLGRHSDADARRDDAWSRLGEAEALDPRRPEGPYWKAVAGERGGGTVTAKEVADAYRRVLRAAGPLEKLAPGRGARGRTIFPEIPALDLDYPVLAIQGLLRVLSKSPVGAAGTEDRALREAQGLVSPLMRLGGSIPAGVEAWLSAGKPTPPPPVVPPSSGGSTPPPREPEAIPPRIVTRPWDPPPVVAVGAFTFSVVAEGQSEPVRLEVSVDGGEAEAKVGKRDEPSGEADPATGRRLLRTRFEATVELAAGEHRVSLRVADAQARFSVLPWETVVRCRAAAVRLLAVGCDGPGAPGAEGVPRLAGAESDAAELARALGDRLGLRGEDRVVLVGADAVPERVSQELGALAARCEGSDALVVLFASFGGKGPGGEHALALRAAAPGRDPAWLPLASVLEVLRECRAERALLFLDTSVAGEGGRTWPGAAGAPFDLDALSAVAAPGEGDSSKRKRAVLLAAATTAARESPAAPPSAEAAGPSVTGVTGVAGLFTRSLLDALARPEADADADGDLSADEVARFVQDLASFRAAREGWDQDPALAGDKSCPLAPAAKR